MNTKTYTYKLGETELTIEKNDWMLHAESALVGSMGDTKVMVAIALGGETDKDYMPLKVEYQERFYARGEILGSRFNKREGKPSTEATLSARVIDRSIRPYFPKNFTRDINVVVTVLSLGEYDPDIVALNTTALALEISSIPWSGPVGSVRVALLDKTLVINPTYRERDMARAESVIAARGGKLSMIEFEGNEIPESDVEHVVASGIAVCDSFTEETRAFVEQYSQEKISVQETVHEHAKTAMEVLDSCSATDMLDREMLSQKKKECIDTVLGNNPEASVKAVVSDFQYAARKHARERMFSAKKHLDGRDAHQVREIAARPGGLSKQIHGSGLFYRGDTHVLSVATLGKLEDAQLVNGMEIQTEKTYIHHYNFPPYSVGEVGRFGSPGRREIGHGALAEKAIARVLPDPEAFPYTIRVVSEVLSSNGSTSMASTCGSSLALMDAGVPLKGHVAGVAIGMVQESDDQYVLLTDILGTEDHWGDMDFKVAGTANGITAIQLDCKCDGLTSQIITETLDHAKEARVAILNTMNEALPAPHPLTPHVEAVSIMSIPQGKIGLVIGTGGVTIKAITKDSGAKIDIKRDGSAHITGSAEAIEKAKSKIQEIITR